MNGKEIGALLRLEWQLDRQQQHAWGSMALYVISTVFTCYLGVRRIDSTSVCNPLLCFLVLLALYIFNPPRRQSE